MPSNLNISFNDGDLIEADHVKQFADPVNDLESGRSFYAGASAGSSTAYTVSLSPAPESPLNDGMVLNFKAHLACGASPTLSVNGGTARNLVKNGGAPLAANDIQANQIVSVVFEGSSFHLVASASSGGGGATDLTGLSDVTVSDPSTGQVLRKSAGDWINANLSASDIGAGLVDDTEFGHLNGVSSNLQSQINGKEPAFTTLPTSKGGLGVDASSASGFPKLTAGSVSIGNLAAGDMPSGIDAAKIGGGTVDNTEFGHLNGVSGNLQTQIDSKEPSFTTLPTSKGGLGMDASAASGIPKFASGVASIGGIAGADITSGIVAPARLGSGTPDSSNFLRGDGSWVAPSGGGGATDLNGLSDVTINAPSTGQVLRKSAGDWVNAGLSAADIVSGNLSLARGGTGSDFSGAGAFGKVLKKNSASAPLKLAYPTWVGCKVRSTSNTTLNSGSVINWPTAMSYNFPGMHSTTTNSNRLVAPVTGVYRVSAHLSIWLSSNTGNFWVRFVMRENGGTSAASQIEAYRNSTQVNMSLSINTVLDLTAGSYIDFVYYGFGSVQANYSNGDGLNSWAILELVGVSHANDLADDNAGGGIIISNP